jgi:hypothetical protein
MKFKDMPFQLAGLPANTLPEGHKFLGDCKGGEMVEQVGVIFHTRDRLTDCQWPIIGEVIVRNYLGESRYIKQRKLTYSLDDSWVVKIIG